MTTSPSTGEKSNNTAPKLYAEVAVAAPVDSPFTYSIPPRFSGVIRAGHRVWVPFGGRRVAGTVLKIVDTLPKILTEKGRRILNILDLLDPLPVFDNRLRNLISFTSDYYKYPLGETFRTAAPAGSTPKSKIEILLTSKGRGALGRLESSGKMKPTVADNILIEAGSTGKSYRNLLERKFGSSAVRRALVNLEKDGLVEINFDDSARVREKTEVWLRPGPEKLNEQEREQLSRKAPRRAEILEEILVMGELARPRLAERFHNAHQAIKILAEQKLIELFSRTVIRDPYFEMPPEDAPAPILTGEQAEVLSRIDGKGYRPYLLFGITGSGKTEIYLRAIARVRQLGQSALVLVPEISLTPQLVARFRGRFGDRIAVFHSGLSDGERFDAWTRVAAGTISIVIGARSAIFTPLHNIGAIIVDEEHDDSYKQEDRLRYSARDLALVRGKLEKCLVILGSATPAVESYYNAGKNKLGLVRLTERISGSKLPKIEIVDLRRVPSNLRSLSPSLTEAIKKNYYEGGQTLIFLNRRGYSPTIICTECGWNFECPNCSITLTKHRKDKYLLCHMCGYTIAEPECCPHCDSKEIFDLGFGTERLTDKIKALLPSANIERMDRDTTRTRGSHEKIISRLAAGKIDVLVGTQMIAKGLDFPGITLVGVIMADIALRMPDFRSAERTFSLMTQVAGRSGRGNKPGRVIVQTFAPDHYSIACALNHDYETFYNKEIEYRREAWYPPFCRMALMRFSGEDADRLRRTGTEIADRLGEQLNSLPGRFSVMGPTPSPIERSHGLWRFQIMLKASTPSGMSRLAKAAKTAADHFLSTEDKFTLDIDPHNMLL
jgi:primosomal protein N' (replication factor Y) (superfamily II helicase)